MISYVQGAEGQSSAASSASAAFGSNNTEHNSIMVAVGWVGASDLVDVTVTDSLGNVYAPLAGSGIVSPGTHTWAGIFIVLDCIGGANSITVTSNLTGDITLAAHEVSPDSGNLLQLDGTRSLGGTSGPLPVTPVLMNETPEYGFFAGFCQAATGSISAALTGTGPSGSPTSRHHVANGTAGSICTFDEIYTGASGLTTGVTETFPGGISAAFAQAALFFAVPAGAADLGCAPAPGEYPASQSVALSSTSIGVAIYYTEDGSTPTTSSPLYSAPLTIAVPTVLNVLVHDPSGFYSDATGSFSFDVYTGTVANPGNIIDGDDTTYATLSCSGAPGNVVAVKVSGMPGTTGGTGTLTVDFEVTQNDLVAASQTLPAWKVSGFISGTETVLASAAPGAGVAARALATMSVPSGTLGSDLAAKISAICDVPGSSGGVQLRVYAVYLTT